jgi:hypothetical protein
MVPTACNVSPLARDCSAKRAIGDSRTNVMSRRGWSASHGSIILCSNSALVSGDTAIEPPISRSWSTSRRETSTASGWNVPKAPAPAPLLKSSSIWRAKIHASMRALTGSSRKHAFRISGIARTLQSKALRLTIESAARRSIAVAARSTSAANVIEYSYMRARSVSTRTSGRISGQELQIGLRRFLTQAGACHEAGQGEACGRAHERHTTARLTTGVEDGMRSLSSRPTSICANRICPYCCWHRARPSDPRSIVGPRDVTQIAQCVELPTSWSDAQFSFHYARSEARNGRSPRVRRRTPVNIGRSGMAGSAIRGSWGSRQLQPAPTDATQLRPA